MTRPEYLSTTDTMLIFMENEKVSLGVAALIRLDGPVDVEACHSDFTHRLNLLPRLRQKVVQAPFGLGLPTWEFDHDFDLRNHIKRVTLPGPGTEEQLQAFVSDLMSSHMDMSRPPWEAHFIDGLADGRGAALMKVHHCMTDGQGGEKIYATIMDFEHTAMRTEPAPLTDFSHLKTPSGLRRIFNALMTGTKIRLSEARRMVTGHPPNPRPQEERKQSKAMLKAYKKAPGVRFGFNANVSGRTHYGYVNLALDEMRAIRSKHGGTVNDVFLTAVSGMLNTIAREEGAEAAERFCRVHLAVNIRDDESQDAWGNYATLIPTLLPMGIDDPIERLQRITEHTRQAKEANLAKTMQETLTLQSFLLPAPLLRLLGASITSETFNNLLMRYAKNLPRNLYATNVRWPEITAYLGGRRIENFSPLVPVAPATGLIFAAITYGKSLQVTLAGDPQCIPDMQVYERYLLESFDALRDAAGLELAPQPAFAMPDAELSSI
jgi:diacylglycerol O-acyltransferase / wax synthase